MEKKQSVRDWLDDLEAQGHEVKFRWEGGNDDGSFWLSIDDVDSDDDMANKVIDILASELGYGSFAGDFNTNGELVYENGEFTGTDYVSETESDVIELEVADVIEVKIPDYLWFDTLEIQTEGSMEDDFCIGVDFHINNGPVVDDHSRIEAELKDVLEKVVGDKFDDVEAENIYPYNEWIFKFDDGELIDGMRVFTIDELRYSYDNGRENDLCIQITKDSEDDLEAARQEEKRKWDEIRSQINNK